MRKPALLIALFIAAWFARYQAGLKHWEHFEQYGDYTTVLNQLESDEPFSRWLVGSAILAGTYRVTASLIETNPTRFIKRASRWWMLTAGIAILLAFPTWATYMALTCPMMLFFGSGYAEYYPFIAPLFVAAVLGHVTRRFDHVKPWLVGPLCAALFLFYVGFLPLACVIGIYALARQPGQALVLVGSAVVTAGVLSLAFFGPTYLPRMLRDLNTGDLPAYPEQNGWAIPGTPFFWPTRAFQQLPGLSSAIARGVGIGPMLAGLALSFRNRRLAVLLCLYAVVSIFTIPRLGWLGDTDLYFQLYILAGLSIGNAIDTADRSR